LVGVALPLPPQTHGQNGDSVWQARGVTFTRLCGSRLLPSPRRFALFFPGPGDGKSIGLLRAALLAIRRFFYRGRCPSPYKCIFGGVAFFRNPIIRSLFFFFFFLQKLPLKIIVVAQLVLLAFGGPGLGIAVLSSFFCAASALRARFCVLRRDSASSFLPRAGRCPIFVGRGNNSGPPLSEGMAPSGKESFFFSALDPTETQEAVSSQLEKPGPSRERVLRSSFFASPPAARHDPAGLDAAFFFRMRPPLLPSNGRRVIFRSSATPLAGGPPLGMGARPSQQCALLNADGIASLPLPPSAFRVFFFLFFFAPFKRRSASFSGPRAVTRAPCRTTESENCANFVF